ncbi:MAG TPA: hypothetical protein VF310_01145 [Vicinamibacteria bacterium]
MRLCCRRATRGLALAAGLAAASGAAAAREMQPNAPARQRVLRTWWHTEKVKGQEVRYRSEVVFDYVAGAASQKDYDIDGRLVNSNRIAQPRPSAEEIAEAVSIIQADAKLAPIVEQAQPIYEGGFVLEEGKGYACAPGTRCLQIMLLSRGDRMGLLRWVVVDLARQTVAYPNYGAVERSRRTGARREVRQ